jgi:putative RecB family exonuclease
MLVLAVDVPGNLAPGVDPTDAAHPADPLPSGDTAARPRRPLALSPSRASDFKTCPLLYRLRAVDRLPESPSAPAVRGTLVHAVLERMFDRPGPDRTPDAAASSIGPVWRELIEEYAELAGLVPDEDLDAWLASAEDLVRSYFRLEDPRRLTPEGCEIAIEVEIAEGVPLRGFVDRLDRAATGELRIVDYKTGASPDPDFEAKAMYQLKFYALMIYRLRGVVPSQLKLIYLGDVRSLTYTPSEAELVAFEAGVIALWRTVRRALETGYFPARRSKGCDWCLYQSICPEWGGTPPPYPGPPAELGEAAAAAAN